MGNNLLNNFISSPQPLVIEYDMNEIIILLINIQRSDLIRKIPMFFISEIFIYANIIPQLTINRTTIFSSEDNCNMVYLSTSCVSHMKYFLPSSIKFIIESKDQGWSSYPDQIGTRTSNTWGEVSLSSNTHHHPISEKYEIFRNIHAGRSYETQEVIFNNESKLMTDLIKQCKSNNTNSNNHVHIMLHVRSMYPGWHINMNSAIIEIAFDLKPNWELLLFDTYCKEKNN